MKQLVRSIDTIRYDTMRGLALCFSLSLSLSLPLFCFHINLCFAFVSPLSVSVRYFVYRFASHRLRCMNDESVAPTVITSRCSGLRLSTTARSPASSKRSARPNRRDRRSKSIRCLRQAWKSLLRLRLVVGAKMAYRAFFAGISPSRCRTLRRTKKRSSAHTRSACGGSGL